MPASHLEDEVPAALERRKRVIALVAARTKLEAAARLVKEVRADLLGAPIMWEQYQAIDIAHDIDAYIQSVTSAIELIP